MSEQITVNTEWMLRELELCAVVAMRQAVPELRRYVALRQALPTADLRSDEALQQQLSRYVGLRGKLRSQRERVFEVIEAFKLSPRPRFETLLESLSALTGQVEKSVASAVLALLDPSQPVIDRELRQLLPRYGFPMLAEAPEFDECVRWHAALQSLFDALFAEPRWAALKARQLAQLPPAMVASLNDVRLLNAHLSQARRLVSLMGMPRLGTPVDSAGASQVQPAGPRPRVRLHLCR